MCLTADSVYASIQDSAAGRHAMTEHCQADQTGRTKLFLHQLKGVDLLQSHTHVPEHFMKHLKVTKTLTNAPDQKRSLNGSEVLLFKGQCLQQGVQS